VGFFMHIYQVHCSSCTLLVSETRFFLRFESSNRTFFCFNYRSLHQFTLAPHGNVQVQLQSGHFDVADRLFHHMGELWKGSTQSMGDVKELIPEFYYLDDMFVNSSCLPLGTRQNGETVSNVVRITFQILFTRIYDCCLFHLSCIQC
jgi:hypothetical protein